MIKFKTISVKDWKHAVDENASERTKKRRLKKLALKACKEVALKYFGPWPTEIEMGVTYYTWKIKPFAKPGYFIVCMVDTGISIHDVGREGPVVYRYSYLDN